MTGILGPQLRACLHALAARAWVVFDILAGTYVALRTLPPAGRTARLGPCPAQRNSAF
ncbi:hypothetical protein [Paraburkholderia monticola]|uniref:hypothetical protein n=1 Tax=Paraburkholderia monticola TaxID=1399968 RepID=UPI00137A40ED|nr:hypothetical protein [Paraburkholderia monticola]